MMLEYFQGLEASRREKIQAQSQLPNARRKFALEIARHGQRLFSVQEKMAWCGVVVPFDLLNAMGVNSCFVEFVGAMLASTGASSSFLDRAAQAGYFSDSCAYHRSVIGAALAGLMPEPDFLIATTAPCSGGLATIENLARHYGKDLFVLHLPYDRGERGVQNLAGQLKTMVEFVSGHLGRAPDPSDIAAAIEKTNRARVVIREVYRLASQIPSPLRSNDLKDFGIVVALFLGTEAAVEIAQAYKDELMMRSREMENASASRQVRLLWIQNRIQFKNPLMKLLDQYHATIVVDELNDINWEPIDPDDPYPGIARRTLAIPLHGDIDYRIERLRKLAHEYRVDGAVNPCHFGCRQGTGARGLIQRSLNEIGVPVLNLEVDCIDQRNFAEGQLQTRLDAFLEMIG